MENKEDKLMAKVQEIVTDWEFAESSKIALKKLRKLFALSEKDDRGKE
jgi:hypothetical protein